ncbi:hypothetical protein V3C99_006646 [Haemonchus contortus]
MGKLGYITFPWICLALLIFVRLIGVALMMFWPPAALSDYALRARTCQSERVLPSLDYSNILATTLWNRVTSIVNLCSYNPEFTINDFKTKSGLRLFHVSSPNMFTTDDECTIVSVNNAMHVDAEEDLAISTKCKFYAAGSHVQNSSSYHEDSAPWNIILDPKRERRPKNETGEPKSYAYWKSERNHHHRPSHITCIEVWHFQC